MRNADAKSPKPRRATLGKLIDIMAEGQWSEIVRYDHFAGRIIVEREPPSERREIDFPIELDEPSTLYVVDWLEKGYALIASVHLVNQAFEAVAHMQGFDPLVEHLTDLEWDGVARVQDWLTRYVGAQETDYSRSVGRAWLIGAVARAMSPGVKFDNVQIFEGPQGVGKSAVGKILGGTFATDELTKIGSRNSKLSLRGKWIVELAELKQFFGNDAREQKHFFSVDEDRFLPPYAHRYVTQKRRSAFFGTFNPLVVGEPGRYLRDPTGGRRYWPVIVGNIRLADLGRERDLLMAEAVALFKSGSSHVLTPDEEELAKDEQAKRLIVDDLRVKVNAAIANRNEVTVATVLNEVTSRAERQHGRKSLEMRVARYFAEAGFKGTKGSEGHRTYRRQVLGRSRLTLAS